ncbi:MAG: glycosyltransferase [Knoellia sp.]
MIDVVHVVIPARDEEQLLPRALASLALAQEQVESTHPHLRVDITVVLDRCVDGSAELVRRAGVRSLTVDHGNVGASRHAGVLSALTDTSSRAVAASDVWIACTDADTVVPPHWLTGHVQLSDTYDAVIGTVEPLGLTDTTVLAQWRARHVLSEGHPHVHGANLGLRASTYHDVGGFHPMATDEDVDLVRRIRAGRTRWVATDTVRVASSARRISRCRGGFADYLTSLENQVG